ncbi:MAG TPA: hypothetical protein VJM84_03490 [Actinomycetota bacterium]|nr:hypothetical protein [Actinomycetota bacterium]
MRRLFLVPIATVLIATMPIPASATTSTSCTFDSGSATVTATVGSGASPTLERSGETITFDGSSCGTATVTNTDAITVSAPDVATSEGLTISIAGGQFAPGKTPEADGNDEIEITINLAETEPLTVRGSDGPDDLAMSGKWIDLTVGRVGEFEAVRTVMTANSPSILIGAGGDDHLWTAQKYEFTSFAPISDVRGGPGDDTIEPAMYAPSSYDGGSGTDTIRYAAANGIILHATASGSGTVDRGGGGIDAITDVEHFVGSPSNDTFYGSQDGDWFDGGRGSDWFLPWGGDDHVSGGDEYDTMTVGASTRAVTFDLTAKTAIGEGADTFDGVEILQGSPTDDVFMGDPELAGVLVLDGEGGTDLLDLRTAESGQTVYTSDIAYGPGALVVVGIPHIIGSPFRDKFSVYQVAVDGGSVRFSGRGGHDVLIGGPRRDVLEGGPGDDKLDGKGAIDTCTGGPGTDSLLHCEL